VHKCVMCEERLGSKEELQQHFRLHANGQIDMKGRKAVNAVKPIVKQVVKKVPVEKKKTEDTSSKWTECDVCHEMFETPTLAIQHKFRKHRGSQKKYFCAHCGKQFPLEVCKENHMKAEHKTEKKGGNIYQCKDCAAQFFNLDAIKYHIRSAHQRVSSLINPVFTVGPSKKIKTNIAGEASSVFYCHLCGQEYLVKFNLQKHIEAMHPPEERNAPPEQLIRCKLCEAVFYSKKAWESHNMLHSPGDLYINKEEDRKLAVARIDQDFDHSRVPGMMEKLLPLVNRKRQQAAVELKDDKVKKTEEEKVQNLQAKKTEDEKESENGKALTPKTEDVKLEANSEEEEETEECKEKPKRPKRRRKVKKS